jgi:SAM-dependent methyltransferase
MILRESGMPAETFWETLFDVDLILDRLGIDRRVGDAVELGCGYGTFSLAVARRIAGVLHTCDIDPAMVARTRQRANAAGIANLHGTVRDVFADGFDVAPASQDACLLFNILHCEEPGRVLQEAARVVRPGGWVHVIHWRHDRATPRGPSLEIRPRPDQIALWAERTGGFEPADPFLDLPPWHFGLPLRRRAQVA